MESGGGAHLRVAAGRGDRAAAARRALDDGDASRALLARPLRGEALVAVELQRQRKDGAPVDLSVSTAPLRDGSGGIIGVVALAADITQRKQLEQQLRQAQKLEAIGGLAGGIAHDFNNLLTVIGGAATSPPWAWRPMIRAGTTSSSSRRRWIAPRA